MLPATAAFVAAAVVALWRPTHATTYGLTAAAFFLLHVSRTESTPSQQLAERLGDQTRAMTAVGTVASEPRTGPSGFATFLLRLKQIEVDDAIEPTRAKCLVRWRGTPQLGDTVRLFGTAEPVAAPRNPGEFDMRSYLARHDVYRVLFVRYPEDGALLSRGHANPILRAAQKSRAWMQRALCRGLDDAPDVQAFLSGIVLGVRHETGQDIEEPFQQTGTLHLFAVAGLHVGIVARLLWMLASVSQLPRRFATAIVIPLLLFYSAVTGLHVSSIRAAVMSSVLLAGFFVERKVFALNSLAAAAFLLLCLDTNELFAIGFQLSFAVVGSIILLGDLPFQWLRRYAAPDPFLPPTLLRGWHRFWRRIVTWLSRMASVSFSAWLGSLPLILWYFYLVAPVSIVANLIVVPIAFFVLAIALLSLVTAPLLPAVSVVFNNANWFLASAVFSVVHLFAQLPAGHYYVAHPQQARRSDPSITVLDAGSGGAVHLRIHGHNWLIDCGSERDYLRLLRQYLHATGVNRLDGVILTHGDSQHIGGAVGLLDDFPRLRWIDNPLPDRSLVRRRLRQTLEQQNRQLATIGAGEELAFTPGVRLRVLHPPRDWSQQIADDQALVAQLIVGSCAKILLTSDTGFATENALLATGADLRSDILIKGQHHSGRSGSDRFLEAVQPALIVATSRDFPPTQRIADQWATGIHARGIKLFRQDETGAVELDFGAREWSARAYITGEMFRSASR